MKRLFSILAIASIMAFGSVNATTYANTSAVASTIVTSIQEENSEAAPAEETQGFHQELKKRFMQGGPAFMGIVLLCLILGFY